MKALVVATLLTFGMVFSAAASGNNSMLVKERVSHLSDKMIVELRLNNYQANEIREINTEIISKMVAIENEFKGDQKMIDEKTRALFAERDRALEEVLSTVQYNNYYGKRTAFNKIDKEFVAKAGNQNNAGADAISLN